MGNDRQERARVRSLKTRVAPFLFPAAFGNGVGAAISSFLTEEILLGCLVVMLSSGIACNWLVVGTNGWKMPVLSKRFVPGGDTHIVMSSHHRFKILSDRIPIGIGMASIGDLLIWIGVFGLGVRAFM